MVRTVTDPQVTQPPEIPVLDPEHNLRSIGDQITGLVLGRRTWRLWWAGLLFGVLFSLVYVAIFVALASIGFGLLGNNIPVAWAFPIVLFAWWVGIGHAGTLIASILLLFHESWRDATNRFAKAITLFAVANAGLMPIIHLGRPWLFYWLIPYPNLQDVYPQYRSPLVWDLFAILTYAVVSLVFWYLTLMPDLSVMRERASRRIVRLIYGALSLGWRNSVRHWAYLEDGYMVIAALSTALVVIVASVGGLDFAVAIVPGYHSTILPTHFLAGAILAGIATIILFTIPFRFYFHLQPLITKHHLDKMAKLLLASALVVIYGYVVEYFAAWMKGETYLLLGVGGITLGPLDSWFWLQALSIVIAPQLLWFRWVRQNLIMLMIIAALAVIGTWAERYILVILSLEREYDPSMWAQYSPNLIDWSLFAGTVGMFMVLMLLFIRLLPSLPIFELRQLASERDVTL